VNNVRQLGPGGYSRGLADRQSNSEFGHFWQVSGRYNHTLCDDACQLDKIVFDFDVKGANNFADLGLFSAM